MTDRKKKGIGLLVSAAGFAVAGIVTLATGADPTWLPTVLSIVGAVAGIVGITVTLPGS